jgi:hypothetical protein
MPPLMAAVERRKEKIKVRISVCFLGKEIGKFCVCF